MRLQQGTVLRGCSYSIIFRLPHSLGPQIAPTAVFLLGGQAFYTTHRPDGYPLRNVVSLRADMGNWHGWTSTSWIAALSAVPSRTRLSDVLHDKACAFVQPAVCDIIDCVVGGFLWPESVACKQRPSPSDHRVGIFKSSYEATSGFTCVTACCFANWELTTLCHIRGSITVGVVVNPVSHPLLLRRPAVAVLDNHPVRALVGA